MSFGVPPLDEAFADQPGPVLFENEPGVDGRPFLLQACRRALDAGQEVVFLTTDRPPGRIAASLSSTRGLTILDGHSPLHGLSDPAYAAVDMRDVDEFLHFLTKVHKAHPGALFVLDSLNGLAVRAGPQHLVRAASRVQTALSVFSECIVGATRWDADIHCVADAFMHRVRLHAVEQRVVTKQFFRIDRIAGNEVASTPILYRSDEDLVRVYIPKLIVTGPADAGKTTFVHAVSDHAVSAERAGATVALDRGSLDRGGIEVQIFGTPGQERFDPMIDPILQQAVGVILVVDSSQPDSFARAAQMLDRVWRRGVHAVVAANKQDIGGALPVQEIRRRLVLPAEVPIVACQATDEARALEVLDGLLKQILHAEAA